MSKKIFDLGAAGAKAAVQSKPMYYADGVGPRFEELVSTPDQLAAQSARWIMPPREERLRDADLPLRLFGYPIEFVDRETLRIPGPPKPLDPEMEARAALCYTRGEPLPADVREALEADTVRLLRKAAGR